VGPPVTKRLAFGLAWSLLAACKENLQAPAPGIGPDLEGPILILHPGQDTVVDSTGTLNVRVLAADRSKITSLNLVIIGGAFGFSPVAPNDTVATVVFPVPLAPLKHSTFGFRAEARDALNHETVTGTVTVTVR